MFCVSFFDAESMLYVHFVYVYVDFTFGKNNMGVYWIFIYMLQYS